MSNTPARTSSLANGWTIPDAEGGPLAEGDGVIDAVIYWAEVWLAS